MTSRLDGFKGFNLAQVRSVFRSAHRPKIFSPWSNREPGLGATTGIPQAHDQLLLCLVLVFERSSKRKEQGVSKDIIKPCGCVYKLGDSPKTTWKKENRP